MCGIAGAWGDDGVVLADGLTEALHRLAHRGPDGRGLWAARGIALGHHRLAIHDISAAGLQPFVSTETGVVVAVNGTFHNAPELRSEAESHGHVFQSRSDTEILLPMWERYGRSVFSRIRGPFAAAVWDPRTRELTIARDPLGKKPLFWSRTQSGIVFASEMAALLQILPERRYRADRAAAFLQCGWIPGPDTVIDGVRSLSPAHILVCSTDGIQTERYWTPSLDEDSGLDSAGAATALEDVLATAVRRRANTDRTLGVLLSGGLDSAAILHQLATITDAPPSFTMGFDDPAHDERAAAAETARTMGSPHHASVFDVSPGPLLRELVERTGELLADASLLPMALVCRRARERAVVLLCGDGGDELLLGYRRHAIARWCGSLPRAVRRPLAACARLMPGERNREGLRALAGSPADALADLVGTLPRHLLVRELAPGTPVDALRSAYADLPAPGDGASQAAWWDLNTYLPGDLLPKTDRASMLSGVEVWSPFLDVDVVETALRIPARTRLRWFRGKQPLRRLLAPHFPPALLRRRKQGFGVPLAHWMREGDYGPFCREILGDVQEPFRELLPGASALPLLERVQAGESRLAPLVHACVTLALFHDIHIARSS